MACGAQWYVHLLHNGGERTGWGHERKTLNRKTRPLEPEMGGSELYNQLKSPRWNGEVASVLSLI